MLPARFHLNCDLNAHTRPPMQSVFKLPLAVTALHLVEQGTLSLDQPIRFLPDDRILPHTHSPLQDKYPGSERRHPVARAASPRCLGDPTTSPQTLCCASVGGPAVVDSYISALDVTGFHLEDGEHGLARDVATQYRNWFEPAGAVQLLRRISDNSPLTVGHTQILLEWMKDSSSGLHRIKGDLPSGTIVMHKTGSSGTRDGVTYATNDIGLVTLPDGRRLAIAIFVTDSTAGDATRDAVIARIAKAAYDASLPVKK